MVAALTCWKGIEGTQDRALIILNEETGNCFAGE